MNPFIETPSGWSELESGRVLKGKLFEKPGTNSRKIIQKVGNIVHVPKDFGGDFIGPNLDDVDVNFNTLKAWYNLEILPGEIGVRYTSKRRGLTELRFTNIGATPVVLPPSPTIRGTDIVWSNVLPGIDIVCEVRSSGVKMLKRIKSNLAPASVTCRTNNVQSKIGNILKLSNVEIDTYSRSWDNFDKSPTRAARRCEINDVVTDKGGGDFEIVNTFTGRTLASKDPETRTKEWKTGETIYPVQINQDITEDIAANGDDGESFSGGWYPNTCIWDGTTNNVDIPGWRFVTVNVPQGATIDAGTRLILTINSVPEGGANNGDLYGNDVDDAAAWGTANLPINITRTTANQNVAWTASQTGTVTVNVVSIFQEIVNRTGFASGNDVAFAAAPAAGTANIRWSDFNDSQANDATFEINFTAAGGDPEGPLALGGKLVQGGMLLHGGRIAPHA